MSMHICAQVHVCGCLLKSEEGVRSLGAMVIGHREPSDVGAGN